MWFDDDKSAGKRLFIDVRGMSRRRASRSNVRLGSKGDKSNRTTTAVLVALLALALLALAWLVLVKAGEALYSQNDKYKIVYLDITVKGGKVLTPDLVKEYTHIREGMNLFEFDAKRVRAGILSRSPHVKSMTITRLLPDTLKIEVVEREPVARFGGKIGFLAADREGYLFPLKTARPDLPIIVGGREETLKPMTLVQGSTRAALEFLDGCSDPRLDLRLKVDSIDVSREDSLLMYVPYDDAVKEVRLDWKGMGTGTLESRNDLLVQLSRAVQTLQSPETKGKTKLDLTLAGGRVYVQ